MNMLGGTLLVDTRKSTGPKKPPGHLPARWCAERGGQTDMIRILTIAVYVLLISSFTAAAYGTVINFDDLGEGLVPSGYAGLTWGTSTLSKPHADSTSFYISSDQTYATPQSAPNYLINGYGVPDLWFEFSAPVNFRGAWFASAKTNSLAAQKVRLVDDSGRTSAWLELTDLPQYLEADFPGSKRIYVQSVAPFDIQKPCESRVFGYVIRKKTRDIAAARGLLGSGVSWRVVYLRRHNVRGHSRSHSAFIHH